MGQAESAQSARNIGYNMRGIISDGKIIANERSVQIALCKWINLCTDLPVLHIPNEGKRSKISGALLKKMGMLRGASDLFIPRATEKYHGLWIELKVGKNQATDSQRAFIEKMKSEGYQAIVCHGLDDAMMAIKKHYNIEKLCLRNI